MIVRKSLYVTCGLFCWDNNIFGKKIIKPRLGAPFGALFCKVKIPLGDASVIYIHKIGRRFAKNHTKNRTNPLRIPYNGDQLDFTIPNNNNLLWFCAFCKDKNLLRDTPRSVMFINNVDCRRVLWDSQQIAVEFDVITGETRGKCTNVLDRAYLGNRFSPVSAQIMRQGADYILMPNNFYQIKKLLRGLTYILTKPFIVKQTIYILLLISGIKILE